MKFAYLIFVHKNPDQFLRLVRKLDSQESLFFIHVDIKANIEPFRDIEQFVSPDKIVWIKRRSIVWAGFNSIRVTLDGLRAIAGSPEPIEYVTHISGQDYPIKPVQQYHAFLKSGDGSSYMEYSPLPRPNWGNGGLERIQYYHLLFPGFRVAYPPVSYLKAKLKFKEGGKWEVFKKLINTLPAAKKFPRKFLPGFVPFEGSNWWTFSITIVKKILQLLDANKKYYSYFKFTHHADEIFFQTLLMNHADPVKDKIVNNNLRYVDWSENTGRPSIFTVKNYDALVKNDLFFARKFDSSIDTEILTKIDSMHNALL